MQVQDKPNKTAKASPPREQRDPRQLAAHLRPNGILELSEAPESAKNQRARILRLLIDARGAWVPLLETMACAAQHNARILELRRRGFNVQNRTERVDGVRHSWLRLPNSPAAPAPEPSKPTAEWKHGPGLTGLPLFDAAVRQ